jgi:hypothetical protein
MIDDDRSWMEFASNVGRTRMRQREAADFRLRWIGAILLLLMGGAGAFLAVRYYGLNAGWWPTLLPQHLASAHALLAHVLSHIKL